MKYILLILLFMPAILSAQKNDLPNIEGRIRYVETVQQAGYTVSQLYDNAKIWIQKEQTHFNNQLDRKEEWGLKESLLLDKHNELFCICRIVVSTFPEQTYYSFNVQLLFKDGGFKYEFSNFRYIGSNTRNPLNKTYEHTDEPIDKTSLSKNQSNLIATEMAGLIRDFKNDMLRKSDFNF
jgi:hypothetical protein